MCDVATAGGVGWVRSVIIVGGILIGGMVRGVAVLLMLEVFGVVRGGEGRSLFLKGDRKRLFAPVTFGLVPAQSGRGCRMRWRLHTWIPVGHVLHDALSVCLHLCWPACMHTDLSCIQTCPHLHTADTGHAVDNASRLHGEEADASQSPHGGTAGVARDRDVRVAWGSTEERDSGDIMGVGGEAEMMDTVDEHTEAAGEGWGLGAAVDRRMRYRLVWHRTRILGQLRHLYVDNDHISHRFSQSEKGLTVLEDVGGGEAARLGLNGVQRLLYRHHCKAVVDLLDAALHLPPDHWLVDPKVLTSCRGREEERARTRGGGKDRDGERQQERERQRERTERSRARMSVAERATH